MKKLLTRLSLVLIVLSAWIAYDNWDRISSLSPATVKDAVQHSMPSVSSEPKKSRVYQWEDAKGKVHVSNTPPEDARNVKIIEYKDDLNVIPGTPPETKKRPRIKMQSPSSENKPNVFSHYSTAVKDARRVQDTMDQRNQNLQKQLQ